MAADRTTQGYVGQGVFYLPTPADVAEVDAGYNPGQPLTLTGGRPALIVGHQPDGTANLRVMLDGPSDLYRRGIAEGHTAGCWSSSPIHEEVQTPAEPAADPAAAKPDPASAKPHPPAPPAADPDDAEFPDDDTDDEDDDDGDPATPKATSGRKVGSKQGKK